VGSVSGKVLHTSPTSVMIVHQAVGTVDEPVRILFGVDGGADGRYAAEVLASFADRHACEITTLAVATTPEASPISAFADTGPTAWPIAPSKELGGAIIDEAWEFSEAAATWFRAAGFKVEATVITDRPAVGLLREAQRLGVDLVVVGARGVGAVERVFLGSVSDRVAHHASATLVGRLRI
jgi:nucleotide-binding universal stress UspA family protein